MFKKFVWSGTQFAFVTPGERQRDQGAIVTIARTVRWTPARVARCAVDLAGVTLELAAPSFKTRPTHRRIVGLVRARGWP